MSNLHFVCELTCKWYIVYLGEQNGDSGEANQRVGIPDCAAQHVSWYYHCSSYAKVFWIHTTEVVYLVTLSNFNKFVTSAKLYPYH